MTLGSGRVATLSAATLRGMVDGYWAARGLDGQGRPLSAAAVDDLLLGELAVS